MDCISFLGVKIDIKNILSVKIMTLNFLLVKRAVEVFQRYQQNHFEKSKKKYHLQCSMKRGMLNYRITPTQKSIFARNETRILLTHKGISGQKNCSRLRE